VLVLAVAAGAVAAGARPAGGAGTLELRAYLARGGHVSPVRRVVPATTGVARAALAELLAGPTAAERRSGYSSAVPSGTRLLGIALAGGIAAVDLTRPFGSAGRLGVAQIVYTATQFPTVRRVAISVQGRPFRAASGRASFERETPPILVERPLPGDTVHGTLFVAGTANVFEARLVVDLRGTGGRLLARRFVMATSGTGTRGTFSTSIPLGMRRGGLTVVAYVNSAKDGRPIDIVRVPVAAR